MSAYSKQQGDPVEIKEQKRLQLKDRQFRLQMLMNEESKRFESELKDLRINGVDKSRTLDSLKHQIDSIKSAREEDRKRLAEEKMYQHWRQNNPEIREIESKRMIWVLTFLSAKIICIVTSQQNEIS